MDCRCVCGCAGFLGCASAGCVGVVGEGVLALLLGENGSCCCGLLEIIDYAQNNSEPQIDLGASCNVTRVICGVASAFDVVDCVV